MRPSFLTLRGISFLIAMGPPVAAQSTPAGNASAPPAEFAARLAEALESGPRRWDQLWAPEARSEDERILDARSRSLFDWSNVRIQPDGSAAGEGSSVQDFVVRGTATWRSEAWGVAVAFWTRQQDERFEVNTVVRRERWELDGSLAVSRRLLAPIAVEEARLDVGVYPGQNALLVDVAWDVRALADGVRHVRFFLDRRAHIYDLRVNGTLVSIVRGSERGALGLEGFSPELESSFTLPEALALGERAVVRFRIRAPLVHMRGRGWVTTLPIRDGAFRERVWIPVLDPSGGDDSCPIRMELHWPIDAYAVAAVSVGEEGTLRSLANDDAAEERRVLLERTGDVRALDFALLQEGVSLFDLPADIAGREDATSGLTRFERSLPGAVLRSRQELIAPLLDAAQNSSRDLSNELEDLLPLDTDLFDELFDDSSQEAESGADDRAAGG